MCRTSAAAVAQPTPVFVNCTAPAPQWATRKRALQGLPLLVTVLLEDTVLLESTAC